MKNTLIEDAALEAELCSRTELGIRWLTATPLKVAKFSELLQANSEQDNVEPYKLKGTYEKTTRDICDCEHQCDSPAATHPLEMLEFLVGRFEHAGVSHAVAKGYAKDIRDILAGIHPPKDSTEPASKDAERYQWLRKNGCKFPDYVTGAMTEILDEEDLDAAVDFNIKEHHE